MKWTWLHCDSVLISSLSWRIQTLFLLPSQLEVQAKGFSMIPLHWIHSLFSCLTPHQLWHICIATPPAPMRKTTMVQPTTEIFTCLGHLSASPRVLLFHYFISQLFPWKEIFQTKKTEACFIILQSTKPVREIWKQIYYLDSLFFKKIPWTLS